MVQDHENLFEKYCNRFDNSEQPLGVYHRNLAGSRKSEVKEIRGSGMRIDSADKPPISENSGHQK